MDLISREAAIEAAQVPDGECSNREERYGIIYARVEARKRIREIPSVPAVPLDKLCEWLVKNYEPPYSLNEIDKLKCPIDFNQQKEFWIVALKKWMEEQDERIHCNEF